MDGSTDLRKKAALPTIVVDYSSSEDLPPSPKRKKKKKSKIKSSSSSSSSTATKKTKAPAPTSPPPACCGRLELELLGFDHGSSAASSAVGEVSEHNIKGGRYDRVLPEWRKGQDFVQPTNIPVRILTNFAVYHNDGTAIRLEKLLQVSDEYGCYVGEERLQYERTKLKESVVVSEHGKQMIEEEKKDETNEREENVKETTLIEETTKKATPMPNVVVFGSVVEVLPPDLRPRPLPRPLSKWQRTGGGAGGATKSRGRGGRSIKVSTLQRPSEPCCGCTIGGTLVGTSLTFFSFLFSFFCCAK